MPMVQGEFCGTKPIWRVPICVVSACEGKGYGDLRRSAGPEERSQSEESLKCRVLSVKQGKMAVWTSNFALYTSDLVYVFGTWHVAVWIFGPKTRVVVCRNEPNRRGVSSLKCQVSSRARCARRGSRFRQAGMSEEPSFYLSRLPLPWCWRGGRGLYNGGCDEKPPVAQKENRHD